MRYLKATFRKVVQIENFAPEEVILEVDPQGKDITVCLTEMKAEVCKALGQEVTTTVEAVVTETPVAVETQKKKTTAKKKTTKKTATEAVATETPVEPTEKTEEVAVVVEEVAVEEEKPVAEAKTEKAPVKEKAVAKKKKVNYLNYDREADAHKADIAQVFRSVIPTWAKVCKPTGGMISKELHGKPFYDADGEILPEVYELVKERFSSFM